MTYRMCSWTLVATVVLVSLLAGRGVAGDVEAIDVRPVPADAGARTYFLGESATVDEAVALRDRLHDAGARNINLFLPDKVIVCDATAAVVSAVATPAGFQRESAADARRVRTLSATAAWGWIVGAYDLADQARAAAGTAAAPAGLPDDFRDLVLPSSPERVREVDREMARWRAAQSPSALPLTARSIEQNSEFLGGSILATFIFPESDGTVDTQTNTWTDQELIDAKMGAAAAYLAWQGQFTPMDISTTFNMLERVETAYEPIKHTVTDDPDWILNVMRTLGYGFHSNDADLVVHEFNEANRALYRSQWVVTCFIADSRSVPTHRFGNGTANYTAYARLGGPYMVEPFPAGGDPNGIGEVLVFSKIVNHECGHMFWTLDEYPGSPGTCGDASGYLNYANGNISMIDPGGNEFRCQELEPCIMHLATRIGTDRPWCHFSRGHLGVIDADGRNGPDIFSAPPQITFEPEGPETVSVNRVTLKFRVVSQAVPNQNTRQDPDHRKSYAAPVRNVTIPLGQSMLTIPPVDGHFDQTTEDFVVDMSLPQAKVTVTVTASNGFVSSTASKTIFFTGVHYTRVGARAEPSGISVNWEIVGDVFNSKFDVFRLFPGQQPPGTMIAHEVPPSGPGTSGFVPYTYTDTDVEPGADYRYYVEGVFTLPCDSVACEYHSPSKVVGQTAMIPVAPTEFVSGIAPNPSHGNVQVSIQVPRTYGGTIYAPQRLPTAVDVTIYDVLGRRVRTLYTRSELNDVLTLRWDGYGDNGGRAPAGVYFLRVRAGEAEQVRKLVLLR